MKRKKIFCLSIMILFVISAIGAYSYATSGTNKPLTQEKTADFENRNQQIQDRFFELAHRPPATTEEEIQERVAEGLKIKADQKALAKEEKDYGYIDNEVSTKEELIKEIDLYIHVINTKINSSYFDTNNEKGIQELDRAKALVQDLEAFKKKILSSDDSATQSLIDEFNKTLKYRKIRTD